MTVMTIDSGRLPEKQTPQQDADCADMAELLVRIDRASGKHQRRRKE